MVPRTVGSFTTKLKSIERTWTDGPLGLELGTQGSQGGAFVLSVTAPDLTNLIGLAVDAIGGLDVSTTCVETVVALTASASRPLIIKFSQSVKALTFVSAQDVCSLNVRSVEDEECEGDELGLALVHEQFHDAALFTHASKPPTPKPTGPRQDSLNPKEITFGGRHIMMAKVHALRQQLGAHDVDLNFVDLGSAVGAVLLGMLVSEPLVRNVVGVELCEVKHKLAQQWAATLVSNAFWFAPTVDRFLDGLIHGDMTEGVGPHVAAVNGADVVFMNNYLFNDIPPGQQVSLNGKMAHRLGEWMRKPHAILATTSMLCDDNLTEVTDKFSFPLGSFSWQTGHVGWYGYMYMHKHPRSHDSES